MDKIAFVNQRYGLEVTGGSEYLCRVLAERLVGKYEVDVLTTCAITDATWANHYGPGLEVINGVNIHRFQVKHPLDPENAGKIKFLTSSKHEYIDEINWLEAQGPYCPELFEYIHGNYGEYKAVIFMTYLFYSTAMCMLGIPNAILLPTAHDEPPLYLEHYKRVFKEHNGFIFNAPEEKELVESVFGLGDLPYEICGIGIDFPKIESIPDFRDKFGIDSEYIIYAGRITEGKGCKELVDNFMHYKKNYSSELKLVLIGNKAMEIPVTEDILYLGFVTEEEKRSLMYHSNALAIASHFESLSIVALEAMAVEKPIIVSAHCPVLKGHCVRSEAGFWFDTYEEFVQAITNVNENIKNGNQLGKKARKYVEDNYSWDVIIDKISGLVAKVPDVVNGKSLYKAEYEVYHHVTPAFDKNNIAVFFASDDKYVPFMSVAIQSIIDTATEENNYDVVVLSDSITLEKRKNILSQVEGKKNIKIRFLEVGYILDQYSFEFTNVSLTRAAFLRMLLPDIVDGYSKILYLDGDINARIDVALLFNSDLNNHMVGVIEDPHIAVIKKIRPGISEHFTDDLEMEIEAKYFNSGVMLFNMDAFRKKTSAQEMLELSSSKKWMWEDQDVLNFICKDDVEWLDESWNVLWVDDDNLMDLMMTNIEYYKALRNPSLIHYASSAMPVKKLNGFYAKEYWETARHTPFYEIQLRMSPDYNLLEDNNNKDIKHYSNPWQRKWHNFWVGIRNNGFIYGVKNLWFHILGTLKYGIHNTGSISEYVADKLM